MDSISKLNNALNYALAALVLPQSNRHFSVNRSDVPRRYYVKYGNNQTPAYTTPKLISMLNNNPSFLKICAWSYEIEALRGTDKVLQCNVNKRGIYSTVRHDGERFVLVWRWQSGKFSSEGFFKSISAQELARLIPF
jgi:hypothetical protein